MTWDGSLESMKSALDSLIVDLNHIVAETTTAVDCYDYSTTSEILDKLCRVSDEVRDLYESINDKEQEMQIEEYEKEIKKGGI